MNTYVKHLRYLFSFVFAITIGTLQAQDGVAIGISTPDANAILDINPQGASRGLLIPRLTQTQIGSFATTVTEGMLVYNTTTHAFQYRLGTEWVTVGTPRGGIIMWSGTTIPKGWALCDGQSYSIYGVVVTDGTSGAIKTPNLKGRFIVGYDVSATSGYNQPGDLSQGGVTAGTQGGAASVKLTSAESGLPSHTHSATITNHAITDNGHSHGVTDPGHSHLIPTGRDGGNGNITREDAHNASDKSTYDAVTNISINSNTTGISIANHTVTVNSVGASDAASAHENRPPYYVLAFIMKL